MNSLHTSSRLRSDIAKRAEKEKKPELLLLAKKPLSQLTDNELWEVYTLDFSFPSGVVDHASCTTCSLCEARKGKL